MFNPIKFTVPILNFDGRVPKFIGSGILVAVGNLHFALTAAHVLEENVKRISFGGKKGDQFKVIGVRNPKVVTACSTAHSGDAKRAEYTDGLDLAVIEIEEGLQNELREMDYDFFSFHKNPQSKQDNFIVTGWPARANRFNKEVRGCFVFPARLAKTKVTSECEVHFELEMNRKKDFIDDKTSKKIELPKLYGVSGGGVWSMQAQDQSTYLDCACSLAGMIFEASDYSATVIRSEYFWNPIAYGWGIEPELL